MSPEKDEAIASTSASTETREELASKLVDRFAIWSGVAGLIPLPVIDVLAVGGLQVQLLRRLSQVYDVDFSENRGKALIAALSTGRLEAAGLDVQLREPPDAANKLLHLKNVVLSPHNAAAPIECYEKMSIRAAKNMLEAFDGVLDPGYVVNPETLPNRRNV